MSATYNNAILLGRAGGEPKITVVGAKETNLAKFSMVTGTGQYSVWHNIQAWGKLAEIAIDIEKGNIVEVIGEIVNKKVGDKIYSSINAKLIFNLSKGGKSGNYQATGQESAEPESHIGSGDPDLPF